jgi:hypothetical protein
VRERQGLKSRCERQRISGRFPPRTVLKTCWVATHATREDGRKPLPLSSVMITRRFQYRSVSAHRSLACGSRVSQAGWAVAAEHLGLFEVDRVTRGGVHPEYPARRDLLVLPTATRWEPRQVAHRRATLLGSSLHLSDTVRARGRATARAAAGRASSRSIRVLRVIDIVSAGPPSACPTALSLHPCA